MVSEANEEKKRARVNSPPKSIRFNVLVPFLSLRMRADQTRSQNRRPVIFFLQVIEVS